MVVLSLSGGPPCDENFVTQNRLRHALRHAEGCYPQPVTPGVTFVTNFSSKKTQGGGRLPTFHTFE